MENTKKVNKKKTNKKNTNKRGFTLIELLAVIVILAILMMTAIPAVTQAIAKSRRDTYATNAKKFIDAVRTDLFDGDLFVTSGAQEASSICQAPTNGTYVAVPITTVVLERGGKTSSFGKNYKSGYVIVANTQRDSSKTDKYTYYFIGVDSGRNGVEDYIEENNLNRSSVKAGNAKEDKIGSVASGPLTLKNGEQPYTLDAVCSGE